MKRYKRNYAGIGAMLLVLWFASIASASCPDFFLRSEDGSAINPITGENADAPYSPKETCGACHDYDTITNGYHFQQGWDRIDEDSFRVKGEPWKFSPGMMGKW